MRVLKEKYLNEYQKCGEIMVAVRKNKFAMACSFCSGTFIRLQSFMRHLQLQHNDKLPFNREVEVYAVEELLSETISSCATEQGNAEEEALLQDEADTNWLKDMEWLEDGVIHTSLKQDIDVSERYNGLENISILKALEDCDVSTNFLKNMNTTLSDIVGDEEENDNIISSTLLREIEENWDESHNTTENLTNKICSTGKTLINETKDIEKDHMPPEKAKNYNKRSSVNGIKNLLQGLDGLEDVDALLENLEESTLNAEDSLNGSKNLLKKQKYSKDSSKDCEIYENQDFSYYLKQLEHDIEKEQDSENKVPLQKSPAVTSNIMEPTIASKNSGPIKRIINKLPKIPANQTFEYKIKNLETMLDEDTTDKDKELSFIIANGYEIENNEKSQNAEALTLNLSLENLKQEKSLNAEALTRKLSLGNLNPAPNVQTNSIKEFTKESCHDQCEHSNLEYLEEPVCAEMPAQISLNDALNEDLTKALVDALADEDNDLPNMPTDSKPDETLSEKLIHFLNQELNEEENQNCLLKPSELISTDKNEIHEGLRTKGKRSIAISETPNTLISKSSLPTKYQKTNLKAKHILNGRLNPLAQQTTVQRTVLTANNRILNDKQQQTCIKAAIPKVIKGDHEAFINQKLHEAITNKPETPQQIQNPCKQKKTPNKANKENSLPVLNTGKIKKEKLTPHTNFVETQRGDRTPLKAEQMFLKQSPKSQEKREVLQLRTTSKRKSYEIQENLNAHEGIAMQNKLQKTLQSQASREQLNFQTNLSAQQAKLPQIKWEKVPQTQDIYKASPNTQESNDLNSTKRQRTSQADNCKKSPQLYEKYILNEQDMLSIKRQRPPQNPKTKSQEKKILLNGPTEGSSKTPLTNNKRLEAKTVKKQSPVENKMQFNDKGSPLTPPKEAVNENNLSLCNSLRPPLTTPQRIKQLSIKLPKFTPEKLMQKSQTSGTKSLNRRNVKNCKETEINSILSKFKLPEGMTITKIPSQDVSSQNQEIVETPVKMGYCKQNFFESSLQANPTDFIGKPDTKPKSIAAKLRQRKASLDVLTTATETTKTPHHSNLDYKSYAVNRTTRKKEVLQRMRNIKKQIFKSIGSDNCTITKVNKTKSTPTKHQQRNKIQIENVQLLPAIPKAVMLTSLVNSSSGLSSTSTKNLNDNQKQAKKKSLENPQIYSPINDDEKLFKKSLKRAASSPLLNEEMPAKRSITVSVRRQQKGNKESTSNPSQKQQQNTSKTKRNNFDVTQLDLAEYMENFLHRDLSANRSNVESFLNEDLPSDDITPDQTSLESSAKGLGNEGEQKGDDNNCNLIDDLLQQVDNEQKSLNNTEIEFENKSNLSTEIVEDFNEAKDIELLDQFGLKIIKLPDIEDLLTLEELETMNEKAQRFADFYKRWPRMWSSKHGIESVAIKEELNMSCQNMLTEINSIFEINLSVSELKRLMNLIRFWYAHSCNSKLIGKKKISESTNRYLNMFNYIPKTVRRSYFCEYCSEYFHTENKYFNHRIKHTGALYPYTCEKCSTGFKTFKALKIHRETTCKDSNQFQCKFCLKLFDSSDMLYEHSKEHLNTVYNCSKCELVFASAVDVKNHMAICNKSSKRMPKPQYTPRPSSTRQKNFK